jgi:hypothetical protein
MAAKIVLTHRHLHTEHGPLEFCVDYYLTEPVNGVLDGMVGFAPDRSMTDDEIVSQLAQLACDHANLQTQNAIPFTLNDVITFEIAA